MIARDQSMPYGELTKQWNCRFYRKVGDCYGNASAKSVKGFCRNGLITWRDVVEVGIAMFESEIDGLSLGSIKARIIVC